MTGVILTSAPDDWAIIQKTGDFGTITLKGHYSVPEAALNVGVKYAVPVVRIMQEENNYPVIPWTPADFLLEDKERFTGTFEITLSLPKGGLYRIETGVDSASTDGTYTWMFRGDVRFHIGVGNLFLVAGQSNAAGFGQDWGGDPPALGVHVLRNNNRWALAAHPLNESTDADDDNANTELRVSGTSPWIAFGRHFQQISGCPVGLIVCAKGGSPIDLWDKNGTGSLYWNMMRKVKNLTSDSGIAAPAGILWYQGCADTPSGNFEVYEEKYHTLISNVRADLGYEIPFFTFQLNREINSPYEEGWAVIREIQRRTALSMPNVYVLPTLNCSLSDNVHNSSVSNTLLGERMAKLCGHVLCSAPAFLAPDIHSAELIQADQILLRFLGVVKNLFLYSQNPAECGFYIEDSLGEVPPYSIIPAPGIPNGLLLTLDRKIRGKAFVSFCHKPVPSFIPPVDGVTYLPVLSFYQFSVETHGIV